MPRATLAPFPVSPEGGIYDVFPTANPAAVTRFTIPKKLVPVVGDNIFDPNAPDVKRGLALGFNENERHELTGGGWNNFATSAKMRILPGMPITSNKGIYTGNYYDENDNYIGHFAGRQYATEDVAPANAYFLEATFDGLGTFDSAYILIGKFGGENKIAGPDPKPQPWFAEPQYPAAKSRSDWYITYEGYLGPTTKDPRFSEYPESGFNFYRDADDSDFGLVLAKGFNENGPLMVVHPWNAINRRLAFFADIDGELRQVASNGQQAFALMNSNRRPERSQKFISVFNVADQTRYENPAWPLLQGYSNPQRVMALQGTLAGDPDQREAFINTWRYTGIAAEKGVNKLIALTCATQNLIEIRRFPSDTVLQSIDAVVAPMWLDFTADGALWVSTNPTPHLAPELRTTSRLYKFVNQGTTAAPLFVEAFNTVVPFLASVARMPDNGVLLGISGTTEQYTHLTAAGNVQQVQGQMGGNFTNATVTDTTYLLLNKEPLRDGEYDDNTAFSALGPDGSIWLGDPGNFRVQHWSANFTTLFKQDELSYLADFFQVAFDRALSQEQYIYAEKLRLKGSWALGVRSFKPDRNFWSVTPDYLLSPHSVQTYKSADGLRSTTISLWQDTRFQGGQPRPDNSPGDGYKCQIVKIPTTGTPIQKGEWVDFEPNSGRTWNLYPEGMRTFKITFTQNVGWFTEVWFRPFLYDLEADGEEWPMFGPEELRLRTFSQAFNQPGTKPLAQGGWNRMYTCAQLPNGAYPGMETAYVNTECMHVGAVKEGVEGYLWEAVPNVDMVAGALQLGKFPTFRTGNVLGGHFTAGLDVAEGFVYVFQDGQFREEMANQTIVIDENGNYKRQFGRLQDNGPGFNSSNIEPYEYANNTGKAAVRKLAMGDHIIMRTSEAGGGFLVHRHVKPTAAPAS